MSLGSLALKADKASSLTLKIRSCDWYHPGYSKHTFNSYPMFLKQKKTVNVMKI